MLLRLIRNCIIFFDMPEPMNPSDLFVRRAHMPDLDPTPRTHSIHLTSLPKRAMNALIRNGIQTVEEATEWSDRELLSLPHFGPASVVALRTIARGLNAADS